MNAELRLAAILAALEGAGLSCLVMGGHAVRFYGVSRNTIDYDLHLAPEQWDQLADQLPRLPLFASGPLIEGPSWRPRDFRRFQIGELPDGRPEWLEFWRSNHLLPPYADLFARREQGTYGERVLAFLSLPDLIRSKETERDNDWQDIALLEECLDARLLAQATAGKLSLQAALAEVRSRPGLENYLQGGHLRDPGVVTEALSQAQHSVTQAMLLPFAPTITTLHPPAIPIEPVVVNRLRTVQACSPLHLALIEAVRRQYKMSRQAVDRADKEAIRASQQTSGASPR